MSDMFLPISELSIRGKKYSITDYETREQADKIKEDISKLKNQLKTDEVNPFRFAIDESNNYGFLDYKDDFVPFSNGAPILAVSGTGYAKTSNGAPASIIQSWVNELYLTPLDIRGMYRSKVDLNITGFYTANPRDSTDTTSYRGYTTLRVTRSDTAEYEIVGPEINSGAVINANLVKFNMKPYDTIEILTRANKSVNGGFSVFLFAMFNE